MKHRWSPIPHRALLAAALAAASLSVALSASKDLAPADEYFGQMKMSFLGINQTFRDQAAYASPHSTDPAIINKLYYAEEALRAWQKKYPKDSQLARTFFLAQEAYKRIWTKEYQDKAWDDMQRILRDYPGTYFSKAVSRNLGIGYTERFYEEAVPCAQPGELQATPSPVATPGARPNERGTRRYEILPQPCLTPAPSPTPTATAMPSSVATPGPATPLVPTPLPATALPATTDSPPVR